MAVLAVNVVAESLACTLQGEDPWCRYVLEDLKKGVEILGDSSSCRQL